LPDDGARAAALGPDGAGFREGTSAGAFQFDAVDRAVQQPDVRQAAFHADLGVPGGLLR